ncbi:anti-sigma factor [Antarcticibacterium flavum]|uniref:Anti-sigma factor n=1 Tax=Antarcticibacterium flavum TaxID=2058175 RepID=A0A5B7X915_9FLAO|nr:MULTISPECIES: anti-sigma factor [Antarcticibacterium]MCM4160618.1 anti-sigma factor [Antarcticibacterium sp. W02-3]QCY71228.1 anti-sigma factor [Antarcticibacterium flavum]
MNVKEYISSGILELYVYGALTEEESAEVTRMMQKYPEVKTEVEEIEKALIELSAAAAPGDTESLIPAVKRLSQQEIRTETSRKNWSAYMGWAASLIFLVGLFFMYYQNLELRRSLQAVQVENAQIETQIANAREDAEKTRELLNVLRSRNIIQIPLEGQAPAPEAFATAYWDKENNVTYIDAADLPAPPQGMVYQVWSLKMQPLTPTSLGLLDSFEDDENKIFRLENINASEGFGITLEPEGGSETPTLERLYTLGVVSS